MVLDAFYLIRVMAMTSGLPALSIHTWHRLRCRRLETDQHLSAARVPQQTEQFGIVRKRDVTFRKPAYRVLTQQAHEVASPPLVYKGVVIGEFDKRPWPD